MKKSTIHYLFATITGLIGVLLPTNLHAAPGDLFETDQGSSTIFKFTPAGSKSTFAAALGGPFGVAVDRSGNVFEADFNTGTIFKFTPGGTKSTFASGLTGPTALTFDASGNLFATEGITGTILKFTPGGIKSTFASGLNQPLGLAFDRSGNLFEADFGSGKIFKFTPTGTKSTFASGLNGPAGLAFNGSGNLFATETGSGRIFKFTGGTKSTFASGLNTPVALAFDTAGNLFEADQHSGTIFKFSPTGVKSTFASGLSEPSGLAFEPASGFLSNISTRALVQTGARVTIGGFAITGTDAKQVLVRAIGPTLGNPPFNIPGSLQDPTLELHNTSSTIASNDDWQTAANANQIPPGFQPPDSRESAILITLQPGNYTAIMAGKNATTGTGLVEVYDFNSTTQSQLVNLSTRGFVGTGNQVMIGGFITTSSGNGSTRVVIRALGPTLSQPPFNVPGTLADPTLTLVDGNGNVIRSNNNWQDTQAAEISATGFAPPNTLEAAVVVLLSAGNYTAIVQGNGGGTGIALVEVYKVP